MLKPRLLLLAACLFCVATAYKLSGDNVLMERRIAALEWQLAELQAIRDCN